MIQNTNHSSIGRIATLFAVLFLFAGTAWGKAPTTLRLCGNSNLPDGQPFQVEDASGTATLTKGTDRWTLVLNNFCVRQRSSFGSMLYANGDLEIILAGDNALAAAGTEYGCITVSGGDLTIYGAGSLQLVTGDTSINAISVSGSLSIASGATINVLHGTEDPTAILEGGTAAGVFARGNIHIGASSLNVNSPNSAVFCEGDYLGISASVVTLCSLRDRGLVMSKKNSECLVTGSCLYVASKQDGIQCKETGALFSSLASVLGIVSHASGINCMAGSAVLDATVGMIIADGHGIFARDGIDIKGISDLTIAGNRHASSDYSLAYPKGTGVSMTSSTGRIFQKDGKTTIFAPNGIGTYSCGLFRVEGGEWNVTSDPDLLDAGSFFTASAIGNAARWALGDAFSPGSLGLVASFLESSIVAAFVSGNVTDVPSWKPVNGVFAQNTEIAGDDTVVDVSASRCGFLVGARKGYSSSYNGTFSISGGLVFSSASAAAIATTSRDADDSVISISGGLVYAVGETNGIVAGGTLSVSGGTVLSSVTVAKEYAEFSSFPYRSAVSYAGFEGFTVTGGSVLGSGGFFEEYPNNGPANGTKELVPVFLRLPGTGTGFRFAVTNMTPAYYGTTDLFTVSDLLCFWLPPGPASLQSGRTVFRANGEDGVVRASGDNEFLGDRPLLPTDGDWYVDAAEGSDANDGRSWETAKATIQAAINAAEEGDLIYVNDGTYGPIATNGKELEIVSVGGAKTTVIDAAGNGRCATLTDVTRPALDDPMDTATVLRGFTLCNGKSAADGAGAIGGLLEDCVIRNNRTETAGGGAAGSTLVRCIVRDNAAPNGPGGGAMVCDLRDCLVWNNSALQGGGLWGWGHAAVNCTVYGNEAELQGGGMMSAVFATNCIVWGNSAPENPDIYGCDEWHLCSPVVDPGCGSISDDPLFVNAAKGDFRLRPMSPCIDAGADIRGEGETDLDGNPRIRGPSVDMGAYERIPPTDRDFDGDGRADPVLFKDGTWSVAASSLGRYSASFGSGDCLPVPADYDGDGTTDLSVYDTVTGDWWIRYSSGGWKQDNFGSLTCRPYPADYDGDGKADLSVWDGRTGDWFIRYSSGCGPNGMSWAKDNFGSLSCIPVPADYDGDGKADLSVRDNATGDWWTRYSRGLNGRSWSGDNFGSTVCDPYPADYDGDGLADLSVYDQQTGDWFVRYSSGCGPNGLSWTKDNFGMKTCIPVPADYDGDGLADFAVFDTATSTFWVRYSGGGWTSVVF